MDDFDFWFNKKSEAIYFEVGIDFGFRNVQFNFQSLTPEINKRTNTFFPPHHSSFYTFFTPFTCIWSHKKLPRWWKRLPLVTENDRLGISEGVSEVISSLPQTLLIPILRCKQANPCKPEQNSFEEKTKSSWIHQNLETKDKSWDLTLLWLFF